MMSDELLVFNNRTQLAKYLHTSRMELWRFEKILPLTTRPGTHIFSITQAEADAWYTHAIALRYNRKLDKRYHGVHYHFDVYPRDDSVQSVTSSSRLHLAAAERRKDGC